MKFQNLLFILFFIIIFSCSEKIVEEIEPSEQFSLIESRKISLPFDSANDILKLDDGYLFFSSSAKIIVAQTDRNFNLLWSFEIKSTNEDLFYSGVYPLNNEKEYLIFFNGYSGANMDSYGNTYDGDKGAYVLKFNSNGKEVWRKKYETRITDSYYVKSNDMVLTLSKYSEKPKFIIKSDSTYYTQNDEYYRMFEFNNEGKIVTEKILNINPLPFGTILFKDNGSWLNYGTNDSKINIEKYDLNNHLSYSYSYNNESKLSNLLYNDNYIIIQGTKHFIGFNLALKSRLLLKIDESNAQITSKLEDNKDGVSYLSKDLIIDKDGNYVSLYFDIYNQRYEDNICCISTYDFGYTTLIKSDKQGNIIWQYIDDKEKDNFNPIKVFQQENDYLIIGQKSNKDLWLKIIRNNK